MTTYSLPAGYYDRPARWEDLDAAVALFNAGSKALFGVEEFTAQDIESEWKTPDFNLETDTRVVIAPDGGLAGYYELWDLTDPHVKMYCWGQVHPQHEGCGIGSYLLAWAVKRTRQGMSQAPVGARVILIGHIPHIHPTAGMLFRDAGFQFNRQSLRMVIQLEAQPPAPQWPDGISVRTMVVKQDYRAVVQAVRDSFRDHWGFVEMPFEQDLARWQHRWETDESFDPSLHFLAIDGEKIAGISLCRASIYDDPEMGWVGTLGVLRPWRRKGLGLALLQHSFQELHRRGKRRIGLGVDASSLTGATRLYEKAGMRSDPQRTWDQYLLELRPGIDLTTQTVEA